MTGTCRHYRVFSCFIYNCFRIYKLSPNLILIIKTKGPAFSWIRCLHDFLFSLQAFFIFLLKKEETNCTNIPWSAGFPLKLKQPLLVFSWFSLSILLQMPQFTKSGPREDQDMGGKRPGGNPFQSPGCIRGGQNLFYPATCYLS